MQKGIWLSLSILHTSWLTECNSFLLLLLSRQFGSYRRVVRPSSHLLKDRIQEKGVHAFYEVITSKCTWYLSLSIIHTSRLTKGVTAFYCCFCQSSLGEENDLLKFSLTKGQSSGKRDSCLLQDHECKVNMIIILVYYLYKQVNKRFNSFLTLKAVG